MSDVVKKGSLLVVFLAVFIDLLGFGMVLPLLPIYGKQFGAGLSESQIGWLVGFLMASFSAMQFFFAPLWGRLSDRIGRRPVLMIGLAGSVFFYTLFALATIQESLTWLFVSRIGAGIAGATISTAQAYIADTTSLAGRARGMALIGAAFGLGFTFGPLFGCLALIGTDGAPGPGPGFAAAGLSLVALVLAWFKLPESLRAESQSAERRSFSWRALGDAMGTPTVGLLLLTLFVCVFSFANFESILSLFVHDEHGAFQYSDIEMLLVFAYVGAILTFVQGGIVRRLAGRVSESRMATTGAIVEIAGFALLAYAGRSGSHGLLFAALAVVVSGFAFITPSLNSLISRRSDPAQQGGVLGVAQALSSLARILGPVAGAKLFMSIDANAPLFAASGLMALGLIMILIAAQRGSDYPAETTGAPADAR